MTQRQSLAALYSFTYFGPIRTKLLMEYFGSSKKAWLASGDDLVKVGLKAARVKDFLEYRQSFNTTKYFENLEKLFIDFVTIDEPKYPKNLLDLDNAPLVLYVKGKLLKRDSNAISIVGTRKMTSYGREVAEQFASGLANFGVTIVSGLARGIDTAAHEAALDSGGRTLAILACGLDRIYPRENTSLARRVVKNGALLSEYPLGYPVFRSNFAIRNRIISGLSKATVVVEGAQRSGTLLTASAAAEQGRQVFAVPGQITSPMSAAPHFLIKQGVKIAFSANEILKELNLQFRVNKDAVEKVMPHDKNELKIAEVLENEPMQLDTIARMLSLDVSDVSARLTIMEIKGLVKNMGGGLYKLT